MITLAAVMGVSSITPALPLVAKTFGLSLGEVALLITVFTLPGIVLSPILGVAADLYGRKKIIMPSVFLFGSAGFLCGFAPDFEWLLGLRFLQGIGVAAIGTLNVTMIGDLFSGNERAQAMGYNSSVLGAGATLYPMIGGTLALLGWNYPFFLPILAIPIAFLIHYKLDNPEPKRKTSLKIYFRNVRDNLKDSRIQILFVATVVSFLMLYGPIITFLPFLIYDKFTSSTFLIGALISLVAVSNGTSSFLLGKLAARFTEAGLLKFSYGIYTVALILMPLAPNMLTLGMVIFLFGLAQGINLPVIITMISGLTNIESRAAVLSLNGMLLKFSQTVAPIGISLLFIVGGNTMVYGISAFLSLIMAIFLAFKLPDYITR